MASHDYTRPNVVFILSDDQGQWAAGCYGNREIQTPAIDSIAKRGVRFDNFFCASPVCSPARATLLSGRIPSQHGVHDWIRAGNMGDDAAEYLANQTCYTRLLAESGYTVGLSGKWHLGDSMRPQQGHSHWYAHQKGGGPYFGAPMVRDGVCYEESEYVTDAIADDACNFIRARSRADSPFYLGVHFTAPHSPWIDAHPKELINEYAHCSFESCPDEPFHRWANNGIRWGLEELAGRVGWERARRAHLEGYFAAVTGMDRAIGRVLSTIHELQISESTLVVFTSDNGMNMGHHGVWGKGNGTYPQNMYDTSVKVPFLMSLPGKLREGAVESSMVSAYDFLPTLLELVGVENPDAETLPGNSFVAMLSDDSDAVIASSPRPPRAASDDGGGEVVVFDEYGPVRMIRTREWKYVHRFFYGPDELYDLRSDPEERVNLIGDTGRAEGGHTEGNHAELVLDLRSRLDSWFARYSSPEFDGRALPVSGMGQLSPVDRSRDRWDCFEAFPAGRL